MDKSCIITVTQGDFDYIDEWITYHHSIGVDLILIGFNGKSDEFDKLPKYDYVKYIDFSVNDNEITNNLNAKILPGFSGWVIDESFNSIENIHKVPIQQKMLNILHKYVLYIFNDIKYTIIIDTDEFIDIKNINYKNISELLSNNFTDDKICLQIIMDFYDDNNNIYYEKKPCLERFTHISKSNRNFGLGCSKTIINNFHKDILELNILSPHTCLDPDKHDFRKLELNNNDAKLKHFFTKSLEEWISKMDYNIDADYFRRWRGRIFKEYFQWNTITPEKIKAIDTLLLKYNINYDIISEECISPFLQSYKNIINKDYKNVACISVIDNDNIDNIDNWINENHNVGINKFFIGYYNEKLNLPKYDFVEYIKLNDTLDLVDMYNVLLKTVKNVKYHYILSLETNNFINIKTGDNDISSILNKYFPAINSSIQIEVDDCSNNCKICINNHHIDTVKINMLSKNTCSGYIDGFKIPSDILTIKTNV